MMETTPSATASKGAYSGAPQGWILRASDAPALRVWGVAPEERLRRALRLAGCARVEVVDPGAELPPMPEAGVVALRADWIVDERIPAVLLEARAPVCLATREGEPVAVRVHGDDAAARVAALRAGDRTGLASMASTTPERLVPAYTAKLRKSQTPYVFAARPELIDTVERHTFGASYKGATDLVTKWVWPPVARWATGVLARAGVRPNTVTAASWVLAALTVWFFLEGRFGLGLVSAWLMTFLDTVDGKLARVTLTSSRLGDVLDHGLDLIHPPIWWWAWGVGMGAPLSPAVWIVIAGYFLGRLLEGAFLAAFKMETHSWRPIDTLFRTITARRNPNLILLMVGALAGRPDLGMTMVAIWTVLSLSFHAARLLQAFVARARGRAVEPWDQPTPDPGLAEAAAGQPG